MSILEINNVSKSFGGVKANVDISMSVEKGKIVGLIGPNGSGKTTLTKKLSEHYKWIANYEDVENNPYLNDFYKDMQRWSFNLQVYFLNSRFRQVIDIKNSKKTHIQDRTIYEDAHIFAPNLHTMGLMSTRDFNNYQDIFNLMDEFVKGPDLLIYLRSSVSTLVGVPPRKDGNSQLLTEVIS